MIVPLIQCLKFMHNIIAAMVYALSLNSEACDGVVALCWILLQCLLYLPSMHVSLFVKGPVQWFYFFCWFLRVPSWAVSCFLVGFLFTFFIVYQKISVFQNQWIPWNIFPEFALLAYDKMPCSCHLDWHISIWLWHRFSIKHPSIGLTMIKSLKRGLNKELFGYRWVDILDVNLSSLGRCSHPSNVFICREGRRNTEKHGKRFVTSVGANLTWCTSA